MLLFALLLFGFNRQGISLEKPGLYRSTFESKEISLRYAIYVPHIREGKAPLVLALHYGWDRSRPFQPYLGESTLKNLFRPGLRQLQAVMIAPDSMGQSWNDPKVATAVIELLQTLLANPKVDTTKVVITGFSLGGRGTWHMLQKHPKLFSAAIPIAIAVPKGIKEVQMPVYGIIGSKDRSINEKTARKRVKRLKAQGASIRLVVLDGVVHHDTVSYIPALRETVPWLREIWQNQR